MAAAIGGICPRLSGEAVAVLESHPWKGNVRELQHVMERASILVEKRGHGSDRAPLLPLSTAPVHPGSRSLSCSSIAS